MAKQKNAAKKPVKKRTTKPKQAKRLASKGGKRQKKASQASPRPRGRPKRTKAPPLIERPRHGPPITETELNTLPAKLPVEDIEAHTDFYPRRALSIDRTAQITEAYRHGQDLGPIDVFVCRDAVLVKYRFILADGFHRVHIWQQLHDDPKNRPEISVRYHIGDEYDAYMYAVEKSVTPGLLLDRNERVAVAEKMIRDDVWGVWSGRDIARACGMSHQTVAALKKRIKTGVLKMPPASPVAVPSLSGEMTITGAPVAEHIMMDPSRPKGFAETFINPLYTQMGTFIEEARQTLQGAGAGAIKIEALEIIRDGLTEFMNQELTPEINNRKKTTGKPAVKKVKKTKKAKKPKPSKVASSPELKHLRK
jgi:hypothetical protein